MPHVRQLYAALGPLTHGCAVGTQSSLLTCMQVLGCWRNRMRNATAYAWRNPSAQLGFAHPLCMHVGCSSSRIRSFQVEPGTGMGRLGAILHLRERQLQLRPPTNQVRHSHQACGQTHEPAKCFCGLNGCVYGRSYCWLLQRSWMGEYNGGQL